MTVTATVSNHLKAQILSGNVIIGSDTIKMALLSGEFTYDKDAHATWADVSAYELPDGNGYTAGGITLSGVTITENDTDDRADVSWDDPQWNATGELGPCKAGFIYSDTSSDDTGLGCIEFGEEVSVSSGSALRVEDVALRQS